MKNILLIVIFFCTSCSWAPRSREYRSFYSHLSQTSRSHFLQSPYFVVFLVSARRLDYCHTQSFLKTLAKHPSDGSLNGDVGHAWVYLKGEGKIFEGGHSGELGIDEAKYLDGVMDLVEQGDLNPIRSMHRTLNDGFFQSGSGGHRPTYAVKVDLTKEKYQTIRDFIDRYDFSEYSLTGRQCVSFVAAVAALAGLNLKTEVTMNMAPFVYVGKKRIRLWKDPVFSTLTLQSPDILEKSLMKAVKEKRGEYALDWYNSSFPCCKRIDKWIPWPGRIRRLVSCP